MHYADLDKNLRTRLRAVVSPDRWDTCIAGLAARKPQTFRLNRLRTTADAGESACREADIRIESVEDIPDAYALADPRDIARLRELPIYTDGHIYSQGLSSQIPAHCLDLTPGMCVLDATAAPGAKTTQIASLLGGTGNIDACERDTIRFEKLVHTVRQQGAETVHCHKADARDFVADLPSDTRYNRILLDPPCSAMGRIWLANEKTYGYWKSDLPSRHARTQSSLLDACLSWLAPG
ncbi:MAG TPA: hypothetical protein PK765_03450 [bacterium]|nr:hypothetical protein [bacterium]